MEQHIHMCDRNNLGLKPNPLTYYKSERNTQLFSSVFFFFFLTMCFSLSLSVFKFTCDWDSMLFVLDWFGCRFRFVSLFLFLILFGQVELAEDYRCLLFVIRHSGATISNTLFKTAILGITKWAREWVSEWTRFPLCSSVVCSDLPWMRRENDVKRLDRCRDAVHATAIFLSLLFEILHACWHKCVDIIVRICCIQSNENALRTNYT